MIKLVVILILILIVMEKNNRILISDVDVTITNNDIDDDVDIDLVDYIDFNNLIDNDENGCLNCNVKSEKQCYSCKCYIYR